MKRALLLALITALLVLSGCRVRTTAVLPMDAPGADEQGSSSAADVPLALHEKKTDDAETNDALDAEPQPDAITRENEEAARREYDENANAEVFYGANQQIEAPGEGEGAAGTKGDAEYAASHIDETAEQTATQIVSAEEAQNTGVSEEADRADSALYYYTVLLQDRLNSLFECQRLYVYWETVEDYMTVFKASQEHELMITAGGYDVSAKRMANNLRIDDGWVLRKNPDAIVKIVPSGMLGNGVQSTALVQRRCDTLLSRDGWREINAVRNGRVFFLSEELLSSQAMRTAAEVYLAKAMYPTLFEDTDAEVALRQLAEEAGYMATGAFFYAR